MALSVFLGPESSLVEVTDYVQQNTLKIVNAGDSQTATASLKLIDRPPLPLSVEPLHILRCIDGTTEIFEGQVKNRVRGSTGPPVEYRTYDIDGQDWTGALPDDVVPDGTADRPAETEQQRINWLLTNHATNSGITYDGAYVQNTFGGNLPGQVVAGKDVYEILEEICKITGARFYADYDKRLHYFITETENAPFDLSDTPNGTTTFGYRDLKLPDEMFELVNQVHVFGQEGIARVRDDATSQSLYDIHEGVLRDANLTTDADADAAGDAYLAEHAYPKGPIELVCFRAGLRAGMLINLTSALWSVNAEYRIASVESTIIPGSKGELKYRVILGDRPTSLGTIISKQTGAISRIGSSAEEALAQGTDLVAPDVPTGLTVSSGFTEGNDGASVPFLEAEWDQNTEPDLDAYEIEVDRAIAGTVTIAPSVSGSGGSLPAGEYNVKVTGVGIEGGETEAQADPVALTVAAGERLFVNITAKAGIASYNIYASRDDEPEFALNTATTGSNVEVTTEGSGSIAPETGTALDFINPQPFRTADVTFRTSDVDAATYYGVRILAIDKSGNRSAWSAIVGVTIVPDSVAPSIPTGLSASGGYRLVGLRWNRNGERDLAHYQVRWSPDLTGAPDPEGWTRINTDATAIIINDLTPDVLYYFQVRAVDRSDNVVTSDIDDTAVSATENPDAGWSNTSEYVTATPTLIGAADVAFNTVITNILAANYIDADTIQAGTLSIGGVPNTPDFLLVYNGAGQEIGRWDENGLYVVDTEDSTRALRVVGGVLQFTQEYAGPSTPDNLWSTALSADGIIADSIKLGTAPGGHNAVPNASFELSAFASNLSNLWTSSTDWGGATQQVNLDTSTGDLRMTTATY